MQLQPIHIYDSEWSSTFQHLVAPQYDEWFPGLLLRCDEVNHWESGTTMTSLLQSVREHRSRGRPNWVIVPQSVLDLLAQFLALPRSSLLATTYQLELARLYNTSSPHATLLRRSFPFHLCPACIEEGQLIRRNLVLPHITSCPSHQLALVGTCQCGTPLQLFALQSLPFTCQKCCLDWSGLTRIISKPDRFELEQNIMSYYEFFFANGTPQILAKALQIVRETVKRKRTPWVKCLDGSTKYVECYDGKRVSLGFLVELLVSLDLTRQDIMAYEGSLPWWSLKPQTFYESVPNDTN